MSVARCCCGEVPCEICGLAAGPEPDCTTGTAGSWTTISDTNLAWPNGVAAIGSANGIIGEHYVALAVDFASSTDHYIIEFSRANRKLEARRYGGSNDVDITFPAYGIFTSSQVSLCVEFTQTTMRVVLAAKLWVLSAAYFWNYDNTHPVALGSNNAIAYQITNGTLSAFRYNINAVGCEDCGDALPLDIAAAQTLPHPQQVAGLIALDKRNVDAALILPRITQGATVSVPVFGSVAQTLPRITQTAEATVQDYPCVVCGLGAGPSPDCGTTTTSGWELIDDTNPGWPSVVLFGGFTGTLSNMTVELALAWIDSTHYYSIAYDRAAATLKCGYYGAALDIDESFSAQAATSNTLGICVETTSTTIRVKMKDLIILLSGSTFRSHDETISYSLDSNNQVGYKIGGSAALSNLTYLTDATGCDDCDDYAN